MPISTCVLTLPRLVLLCVSLGSAILFTPFSWAAETPSENARKEFVRAVLSESFSEREILLRSLVGYQDSQVEQGLIAWRGGSLYLHETNALKTPFLLESQTDADGNAKGLQVIDGKYVLDSAGKPQLFSQTDLTAVDADAKLRRVIKTTLDLYSLGHSNLMMRRDAIIKLGQAQDPSYLPHFRGSLKDQDTPEIRRALLEAIAVTEASDPDEKVRVPAITTLGKLRSVNSVSILQALFDTARKEPVKAGEETIRSLRIALAEIDRYLWWGTLWGTIFRGLSLSAVLLVAALGLAITFGLMGVINMAHGEFMMIGAYTTYVTQTFFATWFGTSGFGFNCYFVVALGASFVVGCLAGLVLERGVIQFLYRRPLESLLATWGVSLLLQQLMRHIFGAANVQVSSPGWLTGSLVLNDVPFAYNRVFVIVFAGLTVLGTYLILTRTPLGLLIRAVMQNRAMASCMGVRTSRVNMLTFAFGSGLAGTAGACLSQIGNVGPSLGQSYIVDCFMVVVLGGVGNTLGTVSASLGVGVTDQILQPWLGAVMGKITVLAAIILFLQWRPAGLFATRSRSLDS